MVYADIHKTSFQLVNGRYISLTFEQSTEPCCGVNGMLDSMSQPGCTLSSKEYQTMYLSRTCLPCSTKWVAGWLRGGDGLWQMHAGMHLANRCMQKRISPTDACMGTHLTNRCVRESISQTDACRNSYCQLVHGGTYIANICLQKHISQTVTNKQMRAGMYTIANRCMPKNACIQQMTCTGYGKASYKQMCVGKHLTNRGAWEGISPISRCMQECILPIDVCTGTHIANRCVQERILQTYYCQQMHAGMHLTIMRMSEICFWPTYMLNSVFCAHA